MDRRRLYMLLNPDSPARAARLFRLVHHILVAIGIAAMLADTVPIIAADYDPVLRGAYYLVGAFFVAEYVLRLIAAPDLPGNEHHGQLRARLLGLPLVAVPVAEAAAGSALGASSPLPRSANGHVAAACRRTARARVQPWHRR